MGRSTWCHGIRHELGVGPSPLSFLITSKPCVRCIKSSSIRSKVGWSSTIDIQSGSNPLEFKSLGIFIPMREFRRVEGPISANTRRYSLQPKITSSPGGDNLGHNRSMSNDTREVNLHGCHMAKGMAIGQ
jgi:hypothetical protein